MATNDLRLARVLGSQRGYAARWQLLAAGISGEVLDHRVAADRLFVVRHGVYCAHSGPHGRWGQVLTAVLACGPAALASQRTAAGLHQLAQDPGGPVHVLSPGDFSRRRPGVRDHRIDRLDAEDRAVVDGIPCTSAALTIVDMAGIWRGRALERVVDRAIVERRCDETAFADVLARHPRRPGARALARLLGVHEAGSTDTRSSLEEAFVAFLGDRRLPLPALNVPRVLPSGRRIVHDAIWERERVVVELDARATHDTDLRFEQDRERDIEVLMLGLRTVRITRRRLREDPGRLDQQLRVLLDLAA